ncbi:MAG: group II truncated hemoglobin [Gammaproteobacteria bacterium]|nr:group II truncated hemoglobin [Gammaproteobacteria bacterium]
MTIKLYGQEDATYKAAGEYEGIKQLVDDFYDIMSELKESEKIRHMHPQDLEVSRDKLTRFLCAWTGGPRLYREKYGPISIPQAHSHLTIGAAERDAWLLCMKKALAKQDYPQDFQDYMITQLAVPAERCRNAD